MIQNRMGIHAFPSFVVVDKKGKIISTHFLRPSFGELLIRELKRLADEK